MEVKDKVLATMKEAGQPLNAGKIAELSGLDRKEVDKAMKQLKAQSSLPFAANGRLQSKKRHGLLSVLNTGSSPSKATNRPHTHCKKRFPASICP